MINKFKPKYPVPDGIGMNTLKGSKNRYLRKLFHELPAEKQVEVQDMAARHFIGCSVLECEPDPEFFKETITDIRDGKFQDD